MVAQPSPFDALGAALQPLHPVAVVAVLAMALLWGRLGPPLDPRRPGAWLGVLMGVLLYAPTQVWIRGEPTRAAQDIVQSALGVESYVRARAVTAIPEALIAGFATQLVTLFLMLGVVVALGYPRNTRRSATAAAAPALGLGGTAAVVALSRAIAAGPATLELAWPVIQQMAWLALNFGTAYLLARGRLTGRTGAYAVYASLLYAAGAYSETLATIGWHPAAVSVVLAAVALAAFSGGAGAVAARR